jgi:hypothetical protein
MPTKIEAADGIRKMLVWDKSMKAGEPEDDITELLVMIRRRSDVTNALEAPKQADANTLPEKTENTHVLEILSAGHFEPLPICVSDSEENT